MDVPTSTTIEELREKSRECVRSGHLSDAEQFLESAFEIATNKQASQESGPILRQLAGVLELASQNERAEKTAERAVSCFLFFPSLESDRIEAEGFRGCLMLNAGNRTEGFRLTDAAVRGLEAIGAHDQAAGLKLRLVMHNLSVGQLDVARAQLDSLGTDAGSLPPEIRLQEVVHRGILHNYTGELEQAERCFREAIDLSQQLGDQRTGAKALANLGVVSRRTGNLEAAESCWRTALDAHRRLRNLRDEAVVLGNLASLCLDTGRYREAEKGFFAAIAGHEKIKNVRSQALLLGNLARLYSKTGRTAEAVETITRSLSLDKLVGDLRTAAASMSLLGDLSLMRGELTKAEDAYDQAVAWAQAAGDQLKWADFLCRRGRLRLLLGDFEAARLDYGNARRTLLEKDAATPLCTQALPLGVRLAAAERKLSEATAILTRLTQTASARGATQLIAVKNASKLASRLVSAMVDESIGSAIMFNGHFVDEFEPELAIAIIERMKAQAPEALKALAANNPEAYTRLIAFRLAEKPDWYTHLDSSLVN